jgi:2-oxoglutarate ferredoxin oxidoreductase subunit beta
MEMLVNCVIFNDGTHQEFAERSVRADRTIVLKHGEPMIFGANRDKGLVLDGDKLKVVTIGENGITEKDILVHDAHTANIGIHSMLVEMKYPEYPVALGIIRDVEDKTYNDNVHNQVNEVKEKAKIKCMEDLLHSGATWTVE